LPFSEASPIPLCYILFPATLLHQLFFHLPSLHLAIYFFVSLLVLFIPNSYTILFWEFYFSPLSVNAQINTIYITLLSVMVGFLTIAYISLLVNILQFFPLSYTGPKILLYIFLSKMLNFSIFLFVSVEISDAYNYIFVV
jgi:hypothetical protein